MKAGRYSNTCIRRLVKIGYLKPIRYKFDGLVFDDVAGLIGDDIIISITTSWFNVPYINMGYCIKEERMYTVVRPLL